jgi:hypothetical protein
MTRAKPRWIVVLVLIAAVFGGPGGLSGPKGAAALEIGDRAPDFSLPATTGGKVSLSQFRGKKLVLLEFYGADFSPV